MRSASATACSRSGSLPCVRRGRGLPQRSAMRSSSSAARCVCSTTSRIAMLAQYRCQVLQARLPCQLSKLMMGRPKRRGRRGCAAVPAASSGSPGPRQPQNEPQASLAQRLSSTIAPVLACAAFASQVFRHGAFAPCTYMSAHASLARHIYLQRGSKWPFLRDPPCPRLQMFWTGPGDVASARHTPLTAEERTTVNLFKDSTPAVVYITNLKQG